MVDSVRGEVFELTGSGGFESHPGTYLDLPVMEMDDSPAAAYRAVQLDVARQVHSIGVIKDMVRIARLFKVRCPHLHLHLHLHLTDDQNFTFPFPPVMDLCQPYPGSSIQVWLHNRTRLSGTIRYQEGSFSDRFTWIDFPDVAAPTPSSATYSSPFTRLGGFSIRAYNSPILRGAYRNVDRLGQLQLAEVTPPGTGDYVISMKTQHGHASLYLDLNRDGSWNPGEKLITDTPNDESVQVAAPAAL